MEQTFGKLKWGWRIGLLSIFSLAVITSLTPTAYGGAERIGLSLDREKGQAAARSIPVREEKECEYKEAAEEVATDQPYLPAGIGEVNALSPDAAYLRKQSGFDAFNARYQNRWGAIFSKDTGRVKVLYGAKSKRYFGGPEATARSFLQENAGLFGLKRDLSDLMTNQVDRTRKRDHIRLQQTYNGVPIEGAVVLVHATPKGEVTMVQNGYLEGFQPANRQLLSEEEAVATARMDLQAVLGKEAVIGEPKAEQRLVPYKDGYWYIWRVVIPAQNPIGYWVYKIDADSGAIIYKANEILSLKTGKGYAYKINADWHLPKISTVYLTNLYSLKKKG